MGNLGVMQGRRNSVDVDRQRRSADRARLNKGDFLFPASGQSAAR